MKIVVTRIILIASLSLPLITEAFTNKSENFQRCAKAIKNPIWRNKGTWKPDYIKFDGRTFDNHYQLCSYMEDSDDLTKKFLVEKKVFIEKVQKSSKDILTKQATGEFNTQDQRIAELEQELEAQKPQTDSTTELLERTQEDIAKRQELRELEKQKEIEQQNAKLKLQEKFGQTGLTVGEALDKKEEKQGDHYLDQTYDTVVTELGSMNSQPISDNEEVVRNETVTAKPEMLRQPAMTTSEAQSNITVENLNPEGAPEVPKPQAPSLNKALLKKEIECEGAAYVLFEDVFKLKPKEITEEFKSRHNITKETFDNFCNKETVSEMEGDIQQINAYQNALNSIQIAKEEKQADPDELDKATREEEDQNPQEQLATNLEATQPTGNLNDPCVGIAPKECQYDPTTQNIILTPRNANGERLILDSNLQPTRENTTISSRDISHFNNVKEALAYAIGFYVEKNLYKSYERVYRNHSEPKYLGVPTFNKCQNALGPDIKWEEIYKNGELQKQMTETTAEAEIVYGLLSVCDERENGLESHDAKICVGQVITGEKSGSNNIYDAAMTEAQNCEVMARVLKENFDEQRHKDQDYINGGKKVSFDGRLKCHARSIENVDYDECSNLINAYNGAAIGKQGLGIVQQVQTQNAAFDANQKMQESQFETTTAIRAGEQTNPVETQVNSQMLAYEVQKDMINKQKSQAQTRAAIDTASAAALVGFAQNMPDIGSLISNCRSVRMRGGNSLESTKNKIEQLVNRYESEFFNTQSQKNYSDIKSACADRITHMDHDFIPNKLITQSAYAIAAEYGVEAAKNAMSASMLKKQANLIADMMERIKAMDINGEYAGLPQNDAIKKYCEAYPSSPQCAALANGTAGTILNPGGLNVTGGDYGVNELGSFEVEEFGDGESAIDGNLDDGEVYDGPTSTKIADVDKGGEAGAIAPAAKASAGGARTGGGGGGGAGASAGSRNGSPDPEANNQAAPAAANAGGIRPGYNKSNSSYLKGGGNFAANNNKKVANPFAKLFKGKNKDQILKFRGPASSIGKKSGDLFTRITNRYQVVNNKNRLLKYKLTPGK